jgi:hypothetical protein
VSQGKVLSFFPNELQKNYGLQLIERIKCSTEILCWECIDEEGLGDLLCMGYGTMFECVMKLDLLI